MQNRWRRVCDRHHHAHRKYSEYVSCFWIYPAWEASVRSCPSRCTSSAYSDFLGSQLLLRMTSQSTWLCWPIPFPWPPLFLLSLSGTYLWLFCLMHEPNPVILCLSSSLASVTPFWFRHSDCFWNNTLPSSTTIAEEGEFHRKSPPATSSLRRICIKKTLE